jgi:hypothetical protein
MVIIDDELSPERTKELLVDVLACTDTLQLSNVYHAYGQYNKAREVYREWQSTEWASTKNRRVTK